MGGGVVLWSDLRLRAKRTLAAICSLLEPTSYKYLRSDLRQVAWLLSFLPAALRPAQLLAARCNVHHTLRRGRILAPWLAANGPETRRTLVFRRRISRCLLRARAFPARVELAHLSLAFSLPVGRPSDVLRSHLH